MDSLEGKMKNLKEDIKKENIKETESKRFVRKCKRS